LLLLLLAFVSPNGIPSPLFAFASNLWNYKQQAKAIKQGKFFL
jgi:hypothetical protein